MTPITEILGIGGKLIDKLIPDPEAKQKAQMELAKLAQDGEFRELETRMSAILEEAKSKNPFVSSARPSFLYVMYIMILASIPMGILFANKPDVAMGITNGMAAWLQAIPEPLWILFGSGYLGYGFMRSADKRGLMNKMKGL